MNVRRWFVLAFIAAAVIAADAKPLKLPRYVTSGDPRLPRIQFADTAVSVNKRCTVRKILMGPTTRPVYVNRKPLGFCCRMCTWAWVNDPAKYLNEESITYKCIVNPSRPAVIDTTIMAAVNWEYYFFSDKAALGKFWKNPLQYTGRLTDPVSGRRFTPRTNSPRFVDRGRLYYFESAANRDRYVKNPDEFTYRRMD